MSFLLNKHFTRIQKPINNLFIVSLTDPYVYIKIKNISILVTILTVITVSLSYMEQDISILALVCTIHFTFATSYYFII